MEAEAVAGTEAAAPTNKRALITVAKANALITRDFLFYEFIFQLFPHLLSFLAEYQVFL